ncbi:MAG: hypothetical protein H7235_05275 [Bdellovibrionaceae bacterium]|nr:hypothetical protein [Pseudobdellovibrionaceae bacterium]
MATPELNNTNKIKNITILTFKVSASSKNLYLAITYSNQIEVRNYNDALEYVEALSNEKAKIKIRDMCDIQKLITKDLLSDKNQ